MFRNRIRVRDIKETAMDAAVKGDIAATNAMADEQKARAMLDKGDVILDKLVNQGFVELEIWFPVGSIIAKLVGTDKIPVTVKVKLPK
jgi:hypothetical protein